MELNGITVTKHDFKVGNKSMFLLAGEIHYFRIDPNDWDDRLASMKELGCNAISTYIPWNWHEEHEGTFDFTSPEKDLDHFLEEAEMYKLKILARPGPWICSEWMNGAIPQWLLDDHPEIMALNSEGQVPKWNNLKSPPISYLHPIYLDYVNKWYGAVAPIIAKHDHPRGGVILVQPDNEISFGFQRYWYDADYNGASIAFYRAFLQKKYADIDKMNRVHGTGFSSFDEVIPPVRSDVNGKQFLVRCNDWTETKELIIQDYTSRCIAMMRERGVKSPIYVNTPSLTTPSNAMLQNHAEVGDKDEGLVLVGDDMYPRTLDAIAGQDFPLSLSIEQLDAQLPHFPFSPEFQGGHFNEKFGTNDAQMLPRVAIGHGLKAVSIYMMVGGRNPPLPTDLRAKYKDYPFDNYGTYADTITPSGALDPSGRSYDFMAAIGENGQKSDRFQLFQRLFAFVSNTPQLLAASKVHDDIAFIRYQPYSRVMMPTRPLGFALDYARMDQPELSNPFFQALMCMNALHYQPKMVELTLTETSELAKYPVAFGFFHEYMDAASLGKLAEYVKGGGTLVMFFEIPSKSETLEPCDVLTSLIPVEIDEKITNQNITALGHVLDSVDFAFAFKNIPDGSEVIATLADERVCAYATNIEQGKIVHLGFTPPPEDEGCAFFHDFFTDALKLPPPKSFNSRNGVLSLQQQAPNGDRFVTVANLWRGDEKVDFMLDDSLRTPFFRVELKNVVIPGRSCVIWSINRKLTVVISKNLTNEVMIGLSTSELTSITKEGNQLVVQGFNFKNATGHLWIPSVTKPKRCSHKFTYGADKVVRIQHDYPTEIQLDLGHTSLVFKFKGLEVPRD